MAVETLPASWYVDAEAWALDRAAIFNRSWLCAGHLARFGAGAGAFATTVGGRPVVVSRDPAGVVRACLNVCPHRAGPLLWEGEAESCTRLRCRYHGWQFGFDGVLVKAPGWGEQPPSASLVALPCAVWNGLIFVHLGEPATSLGEQLAPLAALIEPLGLPAMTLHGTARHPLACNWKTYVENYLEGYHIPYLHPRLAREMDVSRYEVEVGEGFAVHRVPTAEGAQSQGLWAWLWPDLALNVYQGGMSLERIVAMGPEQMVIEYTYVFDPALEDAVRAERVAMSAEVTEEDRRIVEAVQRNLASGIYRTGWLSPRHEGALEAFQGWVRASR